MLSLPSTETRPPGNGCVSGEKIGIIDWALDTGPLWKLRIVKPVGMSAKSSVRWRWHQPWSSRSNWP